AQTLFDDKGEVSRRAEESFLSSIDTFREIGNEKEAARSLALLGYHLIERGDLGTAKERLREARAIMRRIGVAQLAKVEATLEELGQRLAETQIVPCHTPGSRSITVEREGGEAGRREAERFLR